MSGLVALLSKSVDYAGLFPPAALDMDTVVSNYAEYLGTSQRWMLARLIIPAMRLTEFHDSAKAFLTDDVSWALSALVPPVSDEQKFESALAAVSQFNGQRDVYGGAVVEAMETRASSPDEIKRIGESVPSGMEVFIEIPHASDPSELVEQIKEIDGQSGGKLRAKIRTGGVTQELIPSVSEVSRFISVCVRFDVGFKATAGLHHPLRNEFALTYEDDSPRGTMHGFVNVLVASSLAWQHKLNAEAIGEILSDGKRENFEFSDRRIRWRDCSMEANEVARLRESKISSFGSCSFVEPVQDLQALDFGAAFAEVAAQSK